MKASIIMCTRNKNICLSNTLYSIKRQITNIPYEVCILDENSIIDPKPIIDRILPEAKYKRLEKQVGFGLAHKMVMNLVSDDSDIIIIQSSDVMWIQKDILQKLCKNVFKHTICLPEVHNLTVNRYFYKNFEEDVLLRKIKRSKTQIYSGSKRSNVWFFFLGSILKKDLEEIGGMWCDVRMDNLMRFLNFKAKYLDNLKAIHQKHERTSREKCGLEHICGTLCKERRRRNDVILKRLLSNKKKKNERIKKIRKLTRRNK